MPAGPTLIAPGSLGQWSQRSEAQVREIVQSVLAELPAESRNAGAVMKVVMPQLKGQADGNLVRQIVTELLAA